MKSVSKLALFAALGALTMAPVAVVAKEKVKKEEKGKAPAGPKLNYSKEFKAAYGSAVGLLKKKDFVGAKALWPNVKAAIMNEDDRYEAGLFAYNVARETNDNALLLEGIDTLIASTSTPLPTKQGAMMQRGQLAYNAKDYPTAEKYLRQAYDAGHRGNDVELLLSNSFILRQNHAEALNWIQKAIDNTRASGKMPEKQWFAQASSYAGKTKDTAKIAYWGKELIKADPRPATYHDAIFNFIYANQGLDNHETLDILRLARKTGSLLRENEFKQYMEYVDPRRYPAETLAVLNEGFAAGTISKTNLFFSEQTTVATQRVPELKVGWDQDEKTALADAKGFSALLFGENMLAFGEYARAQKLFEYALSKGTVIDREGKDQSDRARTRLGIAKVLQGNYAGAKPDFLALKGANRKALADYWLLFIAQNGG
jgi:tetratricopeptide (TPR) repeat protein